MNIRAIQRLKFPEGARIPYFGGKWYNFLSKLERKYIKKLDCTDFKLNDSKRKEKITVSLTSFPARIEVVGYAIKSLFNQTVKPDRIILNLSKEQFPDRKIPKLLEQLQQKGLEIIYRDGDLRSHKKYHYVLKAQAENELVITYDDDLIYPEDSIERLYKKHLKYPECIVTNRGSCIEIKDGKPMPYSSWKICSKEGVKTPSVKIFPSTGGGVLYPFGTVNNEAFNIESMMECAFSADDLWMRFMSALNKTMIIKTRKNHKTFTVLEDSQTESLQVENCLEGGNDTAIAKMVKKYPQAISFITGDSE